MTDHPVQKPTRVRRWRLDRTFSSVVIFVAAAIVSYALTRTTDRLDHDYQNVISGVTLVVAGLLLAAWFWVRSPVSVFWKITVPLVALVGLGACVRVDDYTADMKITLAWRFVPRPDERLAPAASEVDNVSIQAPVASGRDYPRFLGSGGRAAAPDVQLATNWIDNPPRPMWRQPIGAGWSAFAVVGNYAVTQEQRGEQELVVGYELTTGRIVWSHADAARFVDPLAMGGVGPRATPTIDGDRVYTQGATGILNCLDFADGGRIWSRNIIAENGARQIQWGRSGSPLVVDNLVVVSAGGAEGKSLVAYDKATGEPVWSAGSDQCSYASPIVTTLAGTRQVVTVNEDHVRGHRLEDGQELWSYAWPGDSGGSANTSQPVPLSGDRVLVSKGYGQGCAVLQVRSKTEAEQTVSELWRSEKSLKTKMSNVVVYKDHIYGLSGGILECVRIDGLKRAWKRGRYGHGQLMLVGDLLLVLSEKGELALVRASPEKFDEVTTFQVLDDKTWNNPALAGDYLLVRNHLEAACYQLPLENNDQASE